MHNACTFVTTNYCCFILDLHLTLKNKASKVNLMNFQYNIYVVQICNEQLIIIIKIIIIIMRHLYCTTKCRSKLSGARLSNNRGSRTEQICLQHNCKSRRVIIQALGREFEAEGAEKQKLRFPIHLDHDHMRSIPEAEECMEAQMEVRTRINYQR